jgi:hypothetical protein
MLDSATAACAAMQKGVGVSGNDQLWIGRGGQKYGPYTEENVRRWLSEGKLSPEALAWREGMTDWVALSSLFPEMASSGSMPPPLITERPMPPPMADVRAAGMHESFSARRDPAQDISTADRAAMPRPPSLPWGLVWLFSVLSVGLFSVAWSFVQANWVRKLDGGSRALVMVGVAGACRVAGYVLYIAGLLSLATGGQGMVSIGALLLLGGWVLYLVAYFSMAASMHDKLENRQLALEIGSVTLFFFTMYYLQGQLTWLARWKRTGRTAPRPSKAVFWVLFGLAPFVIAMLAAIAIPAYQDYIVRAQVYEGVIMGENAKAAVAGYYIKRQSLPADNAAAGLSPADAITGKYVSSVDIADGAITVAFHTKGAAVRLRDEVFVLSPSRDGNGALQWRCGSPETTIPARYLPQACRQ